MDGTATGRDVQAGRDAQADASVCFCAASLRPGVNGTVMSYPALIAACSTAAHPPTTISRPARLSTRVPSLVAGRGGAFCRHTGGLALSVGRELVMADSGDSVTGLPEPGGRGPMVLDEMQVLRLCSVFEPAGAEQAIGGL